MKAKEWHSRTLKVYLSYTLLKKEIHKYFRREEKKQRERGETDMDIKKMEWMLEIFVLGNERLSNLTKANHIWLYIYKYIINFFLNYQRYIKIMRNYKAWEKVCPLSSCWSEELIRGFKSLLEQKGEVRVQNPPTRGAWDPNRLHSENSGKTKIKKPLSK